MELTRKGESSLQVAVFQHTNDLKGLAWSKPILLIPENGSWTGYIWEVKALVTDDGKQVILRDWGTSEEKNGVLIVGAGEKDFQRLHPFDNAQLTGSAPRSLRYNAEAFPRMRPGIPYYPAGALLDFIDEEEAVYAIWFGQTDQWLLISLKDFHKTIVKEGDQIKHLNDLARAIAERRVLEHQPTPLRRAIGAVQGQVAKIFPALGQPAPRSFMTADTTAAYLFLTTRKKSSDKAYIENLLTYRTPGVHYGNGGGVRPMRFNLVTDWERVIGDFLLAKWNGDTNRGSIPKETLVMVPDDPLIYLGAIQGWMVLPMEVPNNGGDIWAYLIPARVPVGKWRESSEITPFHLSLGFVDQELGSGTAISRPREGEIVFNAVVPGEYRLKMVWERHPPAGVWRTNIYTAIPGDYESAESEPFVVKAGERLKGISILCTNRIGDGKAYEEDERNRKESKRGQ